jgi:hypothetical protein
MPLQPTHAAVTRLACATRAPAGGRLNGGVRRAEALARDIIQAPASRHLIQAVVPALIPPYDRHA